MPSPERAKVNSLGRKPQETEANADKPRRGDTTWRYLGGLIPCQRALHYRHPSHHLCRPSGAVLVRPVLDPGADPPPLKLRQAGATGYFLSPLRGYSFSIQTKFIPDQNWPDLGFLLPGILAIRKQAFEDRKRTTRSWGHLS